MTLRELQSVILSSDDIEVVAFYEKEYYATIIPKELVINYANKDVRQVMSPKKSTIRIHIVVDEKEIKKILLYKEEKENAKR